MTTPIQADALLEAIERRLSEISERQHALAVQKSHLVEQLTPLRLGARRPRRPSLSSGRRASPSGDGPHPCPRAAAPDRSSSGRS